MRLTIRRALALAALTLGTTLAVAAVAAPAGAQGLTVVDFDAFPDSECGDDGDCLSLTEDGYKLRCFALDPDPFVFGTNCSSVITYPFGPPPNRVASVGNIFGASFVERDNGGAFDLLSLRLVRDASDDPYTVYFEGYRVGRPRVRHEFFLSSAPGEFATVSLPDSFRGLSGVRFRGRNFDVGSEVYEIPAVDDITVRDNDSLVVTPEPSTGALVGGGVLALIAVGRRQRPR